MNNLFEAIRYGLGLELNTPDGEFVAALCVKYLVGTIDAYGFQNGIKRVDISKTEFSGKTFRLMLLEKAYFLVNLKYAALNCAIRPVTSSMLYTCMKDFDLARNDMVILKRLFTSGSFRTDMRKHERLSGITPEAITVAAMRKAVTRFTVYYEKPLMKHIRSQTQQRLRFRANAENTLLSDFNSDVIVKAVQTYYRMVPSTQTDSYRLNYLRRTCSNEIKNMIQSGTTQKRGRLRNVGIDAFGCYRFELLCASENQLALTSDGTTVNYEDAFSSATSIDYGDKLAADISMQKLLSKFKGRKARALNILTGNHDAEFTAWLLTQGKLKDGMDNTDLQTRSAPSTFNKLIYTFLNVAKDKFHEFLSFVGNFLKSHMVYA